MPVKTYKPYTPSRRYIVGYDFSDITKTTPEKSLTKWAKSSGWRNNAWRITTRFKGGGHKKAYRTVDFRGYDKEWIPAKVASIEYDPFRTCRIALLNYVDGEKRYTLAWKWIKVWDEIVCGEKWQIIPGNRKQLKNIPEGMHIFNLELTPITKGKLIKSAGMSATIVGKDETETLIFVKLPSWEVRKFNSNCRATIGIVWNDQHKNIVIWKAGRQRRKWKKPKVLGINMNPVDHPHGWWEAHSPIWSKKWPRSFSGKRVAPGIRTRTKKKRSDKFIVSRRKKK